MIISTAIMAYAVGIAIGWLLARHPEPTLLFALVLLTVDAGSSLPALLNASWLPLVAITAFFSCLCFAISPPAQSPARR